MRTWVLAFAAVLVSLGLAGCGKAPSSTREYTDEEDAQIEAELKRRVEREGEGSSRRAEKATEGDEDDETRPPVKKKR